MVKKLKKDGIICKKKNNTLNLYIIITDKAYTPIDEELLFHIRRPFGL